MKYKIRGSGATVELGTNEFKAKGGEGSIYIVGDTVYKVCDAGKMVDIRKLVELHALDHPRIVRPTDIIEAVGNPQPVGYTMKLVPGNAITLSQMLSKTYREREGVTPDMMAALVKQIHGGISYIHSKPGYLQVDGNELNYMVTNSHRDLYFIDVNSYKTPNFDADAIMPNIRDWSVGTNFSHLTDWYSFAIVSWYMFTGIHPFKGRHPRFTDLKTAMVEQMKANVSVLDPESKFPQAAVYFPFEDAVPGGKNGAYWQWYTAIFVDGKRLAPPTDFQAQIVFVAKVKEIVGSNNFDIAELRRYMAQITGFAHSKGREIVITTDGLYLDNQPGPKITGRYRVGFTDTKNVPVALVQDENDLAKVMSLETGHYLPNSSAPPTEFACEEIMSCDGRLYCRSQGTIYEFLFIESGLDVIPMVKSVASVMPKATKLHQGVAVQSIFGIYYFSFFPERGHHRQIKVEELTGREITDAKYENKVLMIVAMDKETGQYDRYVFRVSDDWGSYDVRKVENITPIGINFTVLPSGIAVCINEEEQVEVFPNKKDSATLKVIKDPAIKANMRLCRVGAQVRLAHGDKLYSFTMR